VMWGVNTGGDFGYEVWSVMRDSGYDERIRTMRGK
jgi:hypothetical protein